MNICQDKHKSHSVEIEKLAAAAVGVFLGKRKVEIVNGICFTKQLHE